MASNNPQQQQQHPLHPPPTTIAGGGAGGGIGRSAPIRTLPITPGPPLAVPYNSLPGGLMATPPLVKSKLPLTPGRGGQSLPASSTSNAPIAAAHATGRPLSKAPPPIPPSHHQPRPPLPQQPPPTTAQYQSSQSYDPFSHPAPSTPGVTNDPIASSRITPGTENDPVVLARQSPGVAAVSGGAAGHATATGGVSAELTQPHIVPLPPPTQTAFHPLNATPGVAASGLGSPPRQVIHRANVANAPQQQQQQNNYGVYATSQQQQSTGVAIATGATAAATGQHHPLTTSLKQPPSTTPFKQPPQPQPQQQPQTSSSPTKQPPQRTTAPSPSTPDGEIDIFLRGADYNTNPINCKVRPSPLPPSQSTLMKSKTLASRRAWGDVIRVTNDALLGKEAGVHHCCYSELSGAAKAASAEDKSMPSMAADASTVATGAELDKLRQETAELIALRFVSQLKLRRYADLGQEIKHLGLMPFLPDHAPFPHAAIEGILGDIGASSSFPSSPGTSVTDASIDMLSSSPVKASQKQNVDGNKIEEKEDKPMAWKEGSIHSSHHSDPLPSWVPFGLRILAAHQLQYNDGPAKAVDVLYDLRDRTTRTDYWGTQGMEIWTPTINNALVNVFVRKREWRLALKALEDLMDGLSESGGGGGGSVSREVDWWCAQGGIGNLTINVGEDERRVIAEVITAAAHVELLSRQLLILLQSGAVSAAETIQNDVRLHAAEVQSLLEPTAMTTTLLRVANESALVRQVTSRQMVNEGLVLFARCQYTEAVTYFRDALSRQRELEPQISSSLQAKPPGCPTWKDLSSPTLGFDAEPSLTVECLNNLSLCLLYSGHMRSSVQELEGLIREDPCLYLTEGMAFNLCTLYELGSDGEECTKKKKLLQRVAKRFYLHDVGVESFRLG